MFEIISDISLLIGTVFMFIASLGMLRMPDTYVRMSVASKAGTLGVGFALLAAAVHFAETGLATRAIATIVFLFGTAPIAAHMIGRAAYLTGVPMWEESVHDDLNDYYSEHSSRPTFNASKHSSN